MTTFGGDAMNEAIEKYLEAIKADYLAWGNPNETDPTALAVRVQMIDEFNKGLEVLPGKQYIKIVTKQGSSRSVHSFIVKEDGPKFKKGDILKAAGWNAPAKNSARGNIFGEYRIRWTGAEYLR
jgi:hypothetical protein